MRIIWLGIIIMVSTMRMAAQDEPEYRAEIGVGLGMAAYQGDLNGSISKNMQPMFSLMGRYKTDPRSSFAMTISIGKIKGDNKNIKTWYPEYEGKDLTFNNSMVDVTFKYDYNFWPYGTGREYRGAVPLTPYITVGLGFTNVKTPAGSVFTTSLPMGFGVKYKLTERINAALEWTMHFTFSDKIDGVEDPYGIKSSGMFKNTDSFSCLGLTISYDIWAKCKTCNNDNY